jgi:hypothetical protein
MPPRITLPQRSYTRRVRLIVVEGGARAIDSHLLPEECEETVVVYQSKGELPVELALRSVRRIGMLERSGRGIGRAVVLMAARHDDQSMAARHLLARALLIHVHIALAGAGELIFAVGGGADVDLRYELVGLVEALIGEPGCSSVPIRLRFAAPSESSGPAIHRRGSLSRSRREREGDWPDAALDVERSSLEPQRHAAVSN